MKLLAKSLISENQNVSENTNRENRRIASLAVWPFVGAQFSTFWDGNSRQDDGTETKPVLGYMQPRSTDTRLMRTPTYSGQFSLSRQLKISYIFS